MKKVVFSAFLLALFVFMAIKVYSAASTSTITEEASTFVARDTISCEGVIVRDEYVLEANQGGVVDYLVEDGAKVAKESSVATVYASENDIILRQQMRELDAQIQNLQYVQSPTGLMVSDPIVLEGLIGDEIGKISGSVYKDEAYGLREIKENIMTLINRKRLITGEVSGFDDQIAALTQQKNQLQSQLSSKITDVTSPVSGYFSSIVDGYEGTLDVLSVKNMAGDELKNLIDSKSPGQGTNAAAVGKVITQFEWRFATVLSNKEAELLSEGKKVELDFPFMMGQTLAATVEKIGESVDDQVPVIIKSDLSAKELNLVRFQSCEIVLNSYEGIKVPKQAIRTLEGKNGVYVLIASQAKFREIEIIEGAYLQQQDDYVLVKQKDPLLESKTPLMPSDEIVVRAKDLYEGKIVK